MTKSVSQSHYAMKIFYCYLITCQIPSDLNIKLSWKTLNYSTKKEQQGMKKVNIKGEKGKISLQFENNKKWQEPKKKLRKVEKKKCKTKKYKNKVQSTNKYI